MELPSKTKIAPYTRQMYDEFTKRLGTELHNHSVSIDKVTTNTSLKEFITNYVTNMLITDADKMALGNLVAKLAIVNIEPLNNDNDSPMERYNVINIFEGHFLKEVRYFSMEENGDIKVNIISVIPDSGIIVLKS